MSNSYPAPAVVVGVDGSRAAEQAALWAIDEAVSRDIPMRLVYVIDPEAGQLLVTDCHTAEQVCSAGHSVLATRCSNL